MTSNFDGYLIHDSKRGIDVSERGLATYVYRRTVVRYAVKFYRKFPTAEREKKNLSSIFSIN